MTMIQSLQNDMECLNSFIMSKYDMSGSNMTCVMTDASGNFIPCVHTDASGNIIPCVLTPPITNRCDVSGRYFPYYPYYGPYYPYYYPYYDPYLDNDYLYDDYDVREEQNRSVPAPHFPVPPVHPTYPSKYPHSSTSHLRPPTDVSGRCFPYYPYYYPYYDPYYPYLDYDLSEEQNRTVPEPHFPVPPVHPIYPSKYPHSSTSHLRPPTGRGIVIQQPPMPQPPMPHPLMPPQPRDIESRRYHRHRHHHRHHPWHWY